MSTLPTSFGPYALLGQIGQGPLGEVYRAAASAGALADQPVALKVFHPPFSRDPAILATFEARTALARRVVHPHVVPCIESGFRDGAAFTVSELAAGVSLDVLVAQLRDAREAVPVNVAVSLVLQLCDAIAAAQKQEGASGPLIHGGLKPSNVIVDARGVARVLDLGASWPLGSADGAVWWVTPRSLPYLPPEALREPPREPQFDVYSLAVLLVELLSLSTPLKRDRPLEMLIALQSLDLRPTLTSLRNRGFERDLIDLIEWALDPDPHRRVEDASCLLDSLTELAPALDGAVAPEAFWGERVTELNGGETIPPPDRSASWDLVLVGAGAGDDEPAPSAADARGIVGGAVDAEPGEGPVSVLDAILTATALPELPPPTAEPAAGEVTDETPPLDAPGIEAHAAPGEGSAEASARATEETHAGLWNADALVVMGEEVEYDEEAEDEGDDEAEEPDEPEEEAEDEYGAAPPEAIELPSFTGLEEAFFAGTFEDAGGAIALQTGDEAEADEEAGAAWESGDDDDDLEDEPPPVIAAVPDGASRRPSGPLGVGERVDLSAILGGSQRSTGPRYDGGSVLELAVGSEEDGGEVTVAQDDADGEDEDGDEEGEADEAAEIAAADEIRGDLDGEIAGPPAAVASPAEEAEPLSVDEALATFEATFSEEGVEAFGGSTDEGEDGEDDDEEDDDDRPDAREPGLVLLSGARAGGALGLGAGGAADVVPDALATEAAEGDPGDEAEDDEDAAEAQAEEAAELETEELKVRQRIPDPAADVADVVEAGALDAPPPGVRTTLSSLQSLDGDPVPVGMDDIFAAFGGATPAARSVEAVELDEENSESLPAVDTADVLAEVERLRAVVTDTTRRRRYGPLPDGTIVEGQIKIVRRVELEPARALYEAVPAPEALTRRCWECGYAHNTRDDRRCFRCRRQLVSRRFCLSARWDRRLVERELELMQRRIAHPTISRIYAFLAHDGQICRLLDPRGEQLLSAANKDIHPGEALRIALSLAAALHCLAGHGILLSELLTSQVRLTEDGAVLYDPEIAHIADGPLTKADQMRMCEYLGRLLVTLVAEDGGALIGILNAAATGGYQDTGALLGALRQLPTADARASSPA